MDRTNMHFICTVYRYVSIMETILCSGQQLISSIPIHCLTGEKGNDSSTFPQLFRPKAENKPLHLKVIVLIQFGVLSQNIIK